MYTQSTSQCKETMVDTENHAEVAASRIEAVLDRFVDQPIGTCVRLRRTRHLDEVSAQIDLGKNSSIVASDSSDNFDDAVVGIIEKIERQIRWRKGKRIKKLKRRGKLAHIFTRDTVFEQPGGRYAESP